MRKNKNNKKGITLFETLVSTIIFGILMILMFNMSSEFFKLFTTSESRQAINSKFIKAYNQLQRELMLTNIEYVYTCNTYKKNMNSRWFIFPVATNKNGVIKGEGKNFDWQRIFIYYLKCNNPTCTECPGNSTTRNIPYKKCSDKQLIRLIYNYSLPSDRTSITSSLYAISKDISSYLLPFSSDNSYFPDEKMYKLSNGSTDRIAKFVEKKVIATDLLDMNIISKNDNDDALKDKKKYKSNKSITIILSSVRKEEIKKELTYGEADFTKEPASKFVDEIQFTVITKN